MSCLSACKEEIERDYVAWDNVSAICRQYGIQRSSLYLHVRALRLDALRDGKIRPALAAFVERGMRVKVDEFERRILDALPVGIPATAIFWSDKTASLEPTVELVPGQTSAPDPTTPTVVTSQTPEQAERAFAPDPAAKPRKGDWRRTL